MIYKLCLPCTNVELYIHIYQEQDIYFSKNYIMVSSKPSKTQ